MKKKNIVYIISAVIIVLCVIFALLIDVWGSFSYFVLSLMTVFSLVWAGFLIYNYCTDFKKQLEEEIQEKLYRYNLENPEHVNALCEILLKENIDTSDLNVIGHFDESEEFEKLVDEYLKL